MTVPLVLTSANLLHCLVSNTTRFLVLGKIELTVKRCQYIQMALTANPTPRPQVGTTLRDSSSSQTRTTPTLSIVPATHLSRLTLLKLQSTADAIPLTYLKAMKTNPVPPKATQRPTLSTRRTTIAQSNLLFTESPRPHRGDHPWRLPRRDARTSSLPAHPRQSSPTGLHRSIQSLELLLSKT